MEIKFVFFLSFLIFVMVFIPSECQGYHRQLSRPTTAFNSLGAGSITAVNFTNLGKQKCQGKTVVLAHSFGTVRSPGYPRRYKGNRNCMWSIVVPQGYNVRIRFRRLFNIEDSSGCSKDYLMLSNSNRFRNPLIFCGKRRPRALVIPTNKVWIKFRSDDRGSGRGFQMSYLAVDVNECLRDVCMFPSLCRNTVGGYACDCSDGYEKKGRRGSGSCEDIDECKTGAAKCEHRCVNTDGSFYCVCPKGYRAIPDGKCRDKNECGRHNGGCSHFCRNSRGTYRCECPPGYSLHSNHKTCYPEIVFRRSQYTANVKENSPVGTSVVTVTATTQTKPSAIYYTITTENLKLPSKFAINPIQGIISVKGQLDREKSSSYLLEVKAVAKDSSNKLQTTRTFVSVNVLDENDNAPRFEYKTYYLKVPCNATVGRSVYRVKATDLDAGYNGRIKYRFSPETPYFSILQNSGRIKVSKSLRRFCQRRNSHAITRRIVAKDQGKLSQSTFTWIQFVIGPPSRLTRKYPGINTRFVVGKPNATPKTIVHRHIVMPLAPQPGNLTAIKYHENKD